MADMSISAMGALVSAAVLSASEDTPQARLSPPSPPSISGSWRTVPFANWQAYSKLSVSWSKCTAMRPPYPPCPSPMAVAAVLCDSSCHSPSSSCQSVNAVYCVPSGAKKSYSCQPSASVPKRSSRPISDSDSSVGIRYPDTAGGVGAVRWPTISQLLNVSARASIAASAARRLFIPIISFWSHYKVEGGVWQYA